MSGSSSPDELRREVKRDGGLGSSARERSAVARGERREQKRERCVCAVVDLAKREGQHVVRDLPEREPTGSEDDVGVACCADKELDPCACSEFCGESPHLVRDEAKRLPHRERLELQRRHDVRDEARLGPAELV